MGVRALRLAASEEALCSRQVLINVRTALQDAVDQNTPMGLMAKGVLDDGKILPDSVQVSFFFFFITLQPRVE